MCVIYAWWHLFACAFLSVWGIEKRNNLLNKHKKKRKKKKKTTDRNSTTLVCLLHTENRVDAVLIKQPVGALSELEKKVHSSCPSSGSALRATSATQPNNTDG